MTDVAMNLHPGRRALREIERNLAESDSSLDALFFSFTQRARGEKMPALEKIRRKPLGVRILARLGRGPAHRWSTKTDVTGPRWF